MKNTQEIDLSTLTLTIAKTTSDPYAVLVEIDSTIRFATVLDAQAVEAVRLGQKSAILTDASAEETGTWLESEWGTRGVALLHPQEAIDWLYEQYPTPEGATFTAYSAFSDCPNTENDARWALDDEPAISGKISEVLASLEELQDEKIDGSCAIVWQLELPSFGGFIWATTDEKEALSSASSYVRFNDPDQVTYLREFDGWFLYFTTRQGKELPAVLAGLKPVLEFRGKMQFNA